MYKYFSAIILATVLISCWDQNTTTSSHAPLKYSILFFDKTASVNIDDQFVRTKYQNALQNIVNQAITKEGDKLEIYYIHENTAKAKVFSLSSRTPKPILDELNATDQEAAKNSYNMLINKERSLVTKLAFEKMLEKNTNSSNKETNVSGSVGIIARAVETGSAVSAYFFSDMVESIKMGRDFHLKAPISQDQAEEWAKADVQKLSIYNLANVEIKIILPFDPTASSKTNNPNITDYWQIFFDKLGAQSIEEL